MSPATERAGVRVLEEGDLTAVGIVGPAAYAASYGAYWDDPAALALQLETYGASGVRAFLARPDAAAWVAEWDGRIVGFLTLLMDSPDPVTGQPGGAEIPRIYLLPGAQKLGLGRRLFREAKKAAEAAGRAYLWLDVMDSAMAARAAYAKWGFTEIGTRTYDAGIRADLAGMMVGRMELGEAPGG